ncbi:ArsR/SmtB family transcription factor [Embleya sp. NPDC059259]|uniref:ArsR/SmtB family transcription factor n=1 Tax=unclassified Embleya TaxID=2699296 RepID=UPI00369C39F5
MTDVPAAATAAAPALEEGAGDFLKALASETRQQVMGLFAGNVELSVGEVAERSGLGQSTASEHLSLLRRGGLLVSVRDGRTVRYRADAARIAERLDALKAYLVQCCPPTGCGDESGC